MTYHSQNSAGCMDLIKVNQLLSTTRLILSFQIRSDQDESIILNRFSCSFNLMVDLGPAPAIDFDCFQGAMMQTSDESGVSTVIFKIKREQKELYEMSMAREGWLDKKTNNFFLGNQKRFFKVMAFGTYLVYFKTKPKFGESNLPQGVISIKDMTDIMKGDKNTQIKFTSNKHNFEFLTQTKEEADLWLICLKFLNEHLNNKLNN